MKKIIQVHIFRGENQFVAECIDLPVVTQGKTLDELTQNLREAIALQLEGENLADFGLADNPSILASFELEPLVHARDLRSSPARRSSEFCRSSGSRWLRSAAAISSCGGLKPEVGKQTLTIP